MDFDDYGACNDAGHGSLYAWGHGRRGFVLMVMLTETVSLSRDTTREGERCTFSVTWMLSPRMTSSAPRHAEEHVPLSQLEGDLISCLYS